MGGAGHSGGWIKKSSPGKILLLMYMFSTTLVSPQPSEELKCQEGEYLNEKGVCCNKCPPGFKLLEMCNAEGQRSNCTPCPKGQFMDQMNFSPNCFSCKICKKKKNESEESACQTHLNTKCKCEKGFYKYEIDSTTSECHECLRCGPDEKEKEHCTDKKNTVCVCKENYYKANRKCVPCKNCTTECQNYCSTSLNTKEGPDKENDSKFLQDVIVGVAVTAFVLLVLVVFITHMATKWCTKRRLLTTSSQPSNVTQDSSEQVLIVTEEPFQNHTVEVIPQSPVSEQQLSNLPDCVPLEIRIPDLIYMVLDLVPVLQVKQLVRTLGVNDTEIEQAEFDHRSCREAHYQMLRVWVKKGSRAGGGGRGKMLHPLLLQELLDKLREMHLGQAAEELETKYGIQQ